jgi:hypothetical protein
MHFALVKTDVHDQGLRFHSSASAGSVIATLAQPVTLEIYDSQIERVVTTIRRGYTQVEHTADGLVGTAIVDHANWKITITDRWQLHNDVVVVHRESTTTGDGADAFALRLNLDFTAFTDGPRFADLAMFAPPALYDMNDIDGDGVEDYLDTRELTFRDDRLTGLVVMAYDPRQQRGLALSRDDKPTFDSHPERPRGQQEFVQNTDIGSLGLYPDGEEFAHLVASYPFVERARSHALTSEGREPWGAFAPATDAMKAEYSLREVFGATDVDALWSLWRQRVRELEPKAAPLTASLTDITAYRVQALLPYYAELEPEDAETRPAGFVTNCHPQDGVQLGNIIQYGFTGQNVLNALHVLGHLDQLADTQARDKALRVIDFFVSRTNRRGLTQTLYDLDGRRSASWWSGLLLPLAYAEPGADLEQLMGPVYEHMSYAIEPLRNLEGTYLRCMAEEHTALLRAYQVELARGHDHPDWLRAVLAFGEFLIEAQEPDGSWRRAYDFHGSPVVEPRAWFGQTELNQKSSTATAVPVLVGLYALTGQQRLLDAAVRAEAFTAERFVRDMKFNGGIHDSIYSRAQLVDSESILFCLRASLAVWQATGNERARRSAVDAARILCTWIYLWDVPLPAGSTLGIYDFRTTGWSACDTCGAGYIHPYELHAVPDIFAAALVEHDDVLARIATLTLEGSSSTVSTPVRDWGYARYGLQEEGLLVSWWLIDDPMFVGTHFGGRGKGEGNKTCLPWISAVGIDAHDELMRLYGTTDLGHYWQTQCLASR